MRPPGPFWLAAVRRLALATRAWQGLLLVLLAVVSWLALSPAPPRSMDLGWDKLNHTAAFAALALSGCLGFPRTRGAWVAVALGLLAFGGAIELLQALVPGRESDGADLLADALGIAGGAALAWTVQKITPS